MKKNTNLPLVLVVALPILLILSTEISNISFNIMGQPIYLINFVFPLTFLVTILISKKTESKIAINLIAVSLIMQSAIFILKWVLFGTINYLIMEVTFMAFFISHLLVLFGYEILQEFKVTNKFGWLLFVFLVATLIESMFYIMVFTKVTIISLIITITIKLIYDLIMAKILAK